MSFRKLAQERYSVRKFSNRPVEKDVIDSILEIGSLAPTAVNYQPQRILVIQSREALAKLKHCTPYHFSAPVALLVCYDRIAAWKRDADSYGSGEVDASIVATHLMLAAADLGLGSTWVMAFDPASLIRAYAIPDRLVPVALLPMGYPAENARPSPQHGKRDPIAKTTWYDDFSDWREEQEPAHEE